MTKQAAENHAHPSPTAFLRRLLGGLLLLGLLISIVARGEGNLTAQFQTFVTIFMGIFVEAVPFLLAGSVVSGLIAVFVNQESLARFVPRQPILAALVGSLLGFTFPVCECGVVPVTRRLYQKGLPLPVGIAFLLAAPVVNPVVLLSTYAAFGWGPVLIGRFVFTILIAFGVGLLFTLAQPDEVLRPGAVVPLADQHGHDHAPLPVRERLWQALTVGGDDFFDMARYLIVGSMLAATMQTVVPQNTLLALGSGPLLSVLLLMVLAFVLSVCSTVDAFLALSFVSSFTPGSIIGFLVFGPMVDIKSSLMFLGVFKRRIVLYLILLPLALSLVAAVLVNVYF
ncbi:MAG: permease [Ardenticatenaceae bacterium]|nr:permease [Ardenticatenaceae bacterium]